MEQLLGVIDESCVNLDSGGMVYGLSLVIIPVHVIHLLELELLKFLNRSNPFHWKRDKGHFLRRGVLSLLPYFHCTVVLVAQKFENENYEDVRRELMIEEILPRIYAHKIEAVVWESRSESENAKDIYVANAWFRERKYKHPKFTHAGKKYALTWLADATVGAWTDSLRGNNSGYLEMLFSKHSLISTNLRSN